MDYNIREERWPDFLPEYFRTPWGRLSNGFYKFIPKSGIPSPFFPRPAQKKLLELIFRDGGNRFIIPKSRKHGFSTLICLIAADQMLWRNNSRIAILDKTLFDAKAKFSGVLKYAYETLDPLFRDRVSVEIDQETHWKLSNGSEAFACTSYRGNTPTLLHVSERGYTSHYFPAKNKEIETGTFESMSDITLGFDESTGMGKNNGYHLSVKRAQKTPLEQMTVLDWRLVFFGWWENPANVLFDIAPERIVRECTEYLDALETRIGRVLTPAQRAWYQVAGWDKGIQRFNEQPSTVDEIFDAPVEGALYAVEIAKRRAAGAVARFAADRNYPLYVTMDIGFNDWTICWYWQIVGNAIIVLRCVPRRFHSAGMMADVFAQQERSLGQQVHLYFVPHDAKQHHAANASKNIEELTYEGALRACGIVNIKPLKRTRDLWMGINEVKAMLPRTYFDAQGCDTETVATDGEPLFAPLSYLESYHTVTNDDGTVEVVHDDASSHYADGFRYIGEAIASGFAIPQFQSEARRLVAKEREAKRERNPRDERSVTWKW